MGFAGTAKQVIKDVAYAIAPDSTLKMLSIRSRRIIERQARELGLDELARRISRKTGRRVAKGPFCGMVLDYERLPVHGAPKFLGTYEQELQAAVERLIARVPATVLNIGCAEGYYAVGFAVRLPAARIIVADADPRAEGATLANAALNGVRDRMAAIGIIHPGEFGTCLEPGALLVMDCEGAEFTLLNPNDDPILLRTDILVEVHPGFGDVNEIVHRFSHSHAITRIEPTERTLADIPLNPPAEFLAAADERTGPKSWLLMERKDGAAA
jgi:hypothetical protein